LVTADISRNATAAEVQTALENAIVPAMGRAPLAPSLPPNPSFAISGISSTGILVTVRTGVLNHSFVPGQMVTISGAAAPRFDGTFPVFSTPTPTSFTYVGATQGLGAAGVGGTATLAGNAVLKATKAVNEVTITTAGAHNFLRGQTVTIA